MARLILDDARGGLENGPWWQRLFNGYNIATWMVFLNLGYTGLLVSWLMKYTDNIIKLFLGIIICMMSLHMYFAPPNMLLDLPCAEKPTSEGALKEMHVE